MTATTFRQGACMGGDPEYSDLVDALCTGTWPDRSPEGINLLLAWMDRVRGDAGIIDLAFHRLDDTGRIAKGAAMCSTHVPPTLTTTTCTLAYRGPTTWAIGGWRFIDRTACHRGPYGCGEERGTP